MEFEISLIEWKSVNCIAIFATMFHLPDAVCLLIKDCEDAFFSNISLNDTNNLLI